MTLTSDPLGMVLRAATFAADKHRNQRRKDADASPYINHPLAVADVLKREGGVSSHIVICAGLLHDTIEDTNTTFEELRDVFGEGIAAVVSEVTDDKSLSKAARKRRQVEHARDISSTDAEAYFEGNYDPAYLVTAGDYLVGMDGDFNLRRWRGVDGLLNQRVMRINRWRCGVDSEFVKLPLQFLLDHLHGQTSLTTVKHLSAKQVNGIEIPLPPLAEQHRIVAKVDELMALCDRLEAARAEREATRDRLAASSLARLNAPDPETFQADARFVLNALPALTTRPDQITQLRQTILNLAVRGKLVPQDSNDEPASELLNRNPVTAGREDSNRPGASSAYSREFMSPKGWAPTSLGAVAEIAMGQSPPGDTYNKSGEGIPLINGPVEFSAGPFGRTVVNQYTTAPTTQCVEGDLLICVRGSTTGRTNIAGFRACIGRGVAAIRTRFNDAFIRLVVWNSREAILGMGRGIAFPSVSRKQLEDLAFGLPPLAEQHRIVAKVDELMALCDRLETSLTAATATRRSLLDALLAEALAPDEPSVRAA